MRAETPCTCIIQHPCIPLIFYLMTFNIRFYQSFQTNLKHKGWELYFRGQRMVPCECSIEKHGTDAGQSFYVNIYNVIHQNIFVHCRERCGSQQIFEFLWIFGEIDDWDYQINKSAIYCRFEFGYSSFIGLLFLFYMKL